MQFAEILRKYRSESNSERDKGTKFEELMARYFMTDPNEYAGSTYIFKLVLSIITVSVETMKIVDGLPKLEFKEE